MRIVIVGGGLAGPLLAQGLRDTGADIELYERGPADQPNQGYRIHIAPEGDLALRACLPPESYQQVLDTSGVRGSGVRVLDPQLRVVREILMPESADEAESGRHLTVDRLTLRTIMLTGVDVRYEAPFERYELLDDGRVRAFFGDGTVTEADLLVGADGTHSRVRAQLLPHAQVREVGITEIFGRTPLTDRVRAVAPAAALDGFCTVTGPDGMFVPLAAHEFRSGGADYLMWVVAGPAARFPAKMSTMDGTALRGAAAELVADWHPSLRELIGLGDPDTVGRTTMRTAEPVEPWESVPVTLAGDAAHTMVPQGTSAAVALHDAGLLCRYLTETTGPLLPAIHRYEAEMLKHGFAEVARTLQAVS